MTTIRAYMRASTDEQDAQRAKGALQAFAKEHGVKVHAWYPENESGASLKRPELFRLLGDCEPGDVLLLEQVDRLSRLNTEDWLKLRDDISARGVRVVALDLPTSHRHIKPKDGDDFTDRMLDAINGMLLDMLAAIARKDYEDRRRRQAEGIAKAKVTPGKYKGRVIDTAKRKSIREALAKGMSWQWIQTNLNCSRATIASVAKESVAE
ncbi:MULTISPECIES: recombinase family protein [unclassified Caballeronia]|uniref:recombinase family protein n=1 Tax=unclassified Caballeronia TaxID=2646786 RepID=UPI001F3DB12C|nr:MULTISPECIES: recombinase family protein [unclassified Caballeronia]MCE4542131.1 recombinase family protein [Caballeronia sp. PC1]MCE4568823.1 recombinase family protein [Caballeronia sp. CLC5]